MPQVVGETVSGLGVTGHTQTVYVRERKKRLVKTIINKCIDYLMVNTNNRSFYELSKSVSRLCLYLRVSGE